MFNKDRTQADTPRGVCHRFLHRAQDFKLSADDKLDLFSTGGEMKDVRNQVRLPQAEVEAKAQEEMASEVQVGQDTQETWEVREGTTRMKHLSWHNELQLVARPSSDDGELLANHIVDTLSATSLTNAHCRRHCVRQA